MVTIICMFWVANIAFACVESNKVWAFNGLVACILTVSLVGVLV